MKKKFLKVIQVIYDILSLGFIVFVIVAMAVTPKSEGHHDNNVTEVVETKARDNLYANQNYCYVGLTEYGSTQFLRYFDDALNLGGGNILGTGLSRTNFYNGSSLIIDCPADFNYPSSFVIGTIDSGNNFNIEYRVFRIKAEYDNSHSNYDTLTFYYYLNDSFSSYLRCEAYFWYLNSDKTFIVSNSYTFYGSETGITDYHTYITRYRHYFYYGFLPNNFAKLDYDEAYNEGFSAGQNEPNQETIDKIKSEYTNEIIGEVLNPNSTQYQYIYDLGKQEGIVEGMRGTESNAFVVIGQAFSAVGSIFSIEVMPNLPLWVLVFTPLIIVVVIVVVKLIKG